MQTQEISYDADGMRAVGYLALPDGDDQRPGVLVCHEGPGIDDHAKGRARRIAEELGYAAFALDYIGNGERLADLQATMARLGPLMGDPLKTLELARGGAPLKAVVGFHSGLATARPEDASNITGKVLACIGTEDPLVSPKQRADFETEMRAGGVDWRMNLYGGAAHSFTNPTAGAMGVPGIEYHEPTDVRSWNAMLDLFNETLR